MPKKLTDLKPCPFCKSEARRYFGVYDMYGIRCKNVLVKFMVI